MTAASVNLQAVILCGGLGTRLRPLTDTMPKPMAPVNGKPFLYYLLMQLADQGIKRFVLLTGYKGEQIIDYFGDGARWGWSIDYSAGPAEWDTGRRLWEARNKLQVEFLLLYSDNFAQFRLNKLFELQEKTQLPITLLLAPKKKGNMRVSADGLIEAYESTREGLGFDFVEIGYMLIKRDLVFKQFPNQIGFPDFNFSSVLQNLAGKSAIAGLPVFDSYHSISDMVRLELVREYLRPKRILLIDRDGTINVKAPKGEYIASWREFEWNHETKQAMRLLAQSGFKFIVITNQAGVARGMINPVELETIHKNMIAELAKENITILKIYCCPDHWEQNSFMRKPNPGMFFQAASEYNLRMDRCLYVGDDERDCIAAANAGCGAVYLSSDGKDPELAEYPKPYFRATSLLECLSLIEQVYGEWGAAA